MICLSVIQSDNPVLIQVPLKSEYPINSFIDFSVFFNAGDKESGHSCISSTGVGIGVVNNDGVVSNVNVDVTRHNTFVRL